MKKTVAIDGPAGAGKSTIAKLVAEKLGYIYIDTGAMYRAVAWKVLDTGAGTTDEAIIRTAEKLHVSLRFVGDNVRVFADDTDVTEKIRTPEVTALVSQVAQLGPVREKMVELQRGMAKDGGVVMDGRDIGTVIIPDAELKLFLTASPEVRAKRRFLELEEKGTPQPYEDVLADIIKRDKADSEREIAPLKPADDSIVFVNDEYDLEQTICYVLGLIDAVEHFYGREN
ncbi:MAG: (d)CMP kinase [Clostridia bacterium]|nr:(d)CMP kinase [Clostridia bacterium]